MLMQLLVITAICSSPIDSLQLEQSNSKTTRIYFVRHGESIYNARDADGLKRISGKSLEIPLTDKGIAQAKSLGKKLSQKLPATSNSIIFFSTAVRAQHTADQIFEELRCSLPIEKGEAFHVFCEWGQGSFEGSPMDDEFYQALTIWKGLSAKDKFVTPLLPDAENCQGVAQRMLVGLEKVLENHAGKPLIIVSHNAAMNALAIQLNGGICSLSTELGSSLPSIDIDNCSLLQIDWEKGTPIDQAKAIRHIQL